jgi:hypothetical protein
MPAPLVRFGRWTVRAEPEKTRAAYQSLVAASERCGCNICKNYQAARERVFGAEAQELLRQLGIDGTREVEILHTHRISRGRHAYQGWFHLFGALESGKDAYVPRGDAFALEVEGCGDSLSFGFTSRLSLVSNVWVNAQILQLEFTAIVPWVLEIDEPS